jgi:hypothetical protein
VFKPTPIEYCQHCGSKLERKRRGRSLEDLGAFSRRKYCGVECMALAMVKPVVGRGAHQVRARRHLKSRCESCGTTEGLQPHHKNRDWADDREENIGTLCGSCHMKLHHRNGDITPKKPPRPCLDCGKVIEGRPVCSTCRTRRRRVRILAERSEVA